MLVEVYLPSLHLLQAPVLGVSSFELLVYLQSAGLTHTTVVLLVQLHVIYRLLRTS